METCPMQKGGSFLTSPAGTSQRLAGTAHGLENNGGCCDALWGTRDSTAPEELKGGRHQLRLLHTDHNNPEPGQTN